MIATIPEEMYDPNFSLDSFIRSLPADLNDEYLMEEINKRNEQLEAVSSRLSSRIMGSYDAFVQGMVEVGQLNQDIERTAKLCDIGRSHLLTARHSLTHAGFRILSLHRKRLLYQQVITLLAKIDAMRVTMGQIKDATKQFNFPKALALSQECMREMAKMKEFTVIKALQREVNEEYAEVQRRMDVVLDDLCRSFDEERYRYVLHAFRDLGRHYSVVEKIQRFFLNAIQSQTHDVIFAHVLQIEDLTKGSRASELKKKPLKDLCLLLPSFPEGVFVSCLTHVLACMTELMRSHWVITNWHIKHDSEEKREERERERGEGREKDVSREKEVDIAEELKRFRKNMWDHMQRNIGKILTSAPLNKYKIDAFLRILDHTDRFTKIGEAFSDSIAQGMYKIMKVQSRDYFNVYHKLRLEDLKTMLENEMWIAIPVHQHFSLYDIKEFNSFLEISSTVNDVCALSMTVNADMFFTRYENPFSMDAEKGERGERGEGEGEGEGEEEVPEELKQESVDEEGEGRRMVRRKKAANEVTRRPIGKDLGRALLTTTSINVLRYMGKYLHMMRILQPISFQVFYGFCQIFEYYMYTVFSFFATGAMGVIKQAQAESEEELFPLSPLLHKTLRRIHLSLNSQPGANVDPSMVRATAAPLSPIVAHDLKSADSLFALPQRCVAIESLMFVAKSLQSCRTHLQYILPTGQQQQQQQRSLQEFYETSVDACDVLQSYLLHCAARDVLECGDIAAFIANAKWDISAKDLGGTADNPYLFTLKTKFKTFAKRVDEVREKCSIPDSLYTGLWEHAVKYAMYQMVEGFSRPRRCTNEGRALMNLDLQTFRSELKQICPLNPIPYIPYVEAYIKAYYLPQGELLPWVREQKDYTPRQLLSVTILASGKLAPNVREQIVKTVKDYLYGHPGSSPSPSSSAQS